MTPELWNKAASIIEANEKLLVIIGLTSLAFFVFMLTATLTELIEPSFLLLVPVIILFYCSGLGLVRYHYKTLIEKEHKTITDYMQTAPFNKKFMLWYGSIFLTLWFVGLTIMFGVVIKISS